ncbi:copper resistance protein CopC [Microbacteriaceae bacterium VKM Ac-2855]|nr:copper resistance protein CopC [Microbacteriaceae bacterium VKM Ac-2855]
MRRTLAGAVVAGAALALAVAAPAAAHNYLVASTPTADSTLTTQPETISVTTNDNLLDLGGDGNAAAIQVVGPADAPRYYGDGCVTVLGPTASMPAQLGAAGEYTVTWQVVSTDGHPVSDSFTFEWQPDATQVLAAGSATAPDCNGTISAAEPVASDQPAASTASDPALLNDVLWIGGGVLAVVVAAGVTLLVLRRRA